MPPHAFLRRNDPATIVESWNRTTVLSRLLSSETASENKFSVFFKNGVIFLDFFYKVWYSIKAVDCGNDVEV